MMDDIAQKLSELLNSPEGMDRIKSMADVLLKSNAAPEADAPSAGPSPDELQKLLKVSQLLKTRQNDDRTNLLLALKPHLHGDRRARVDQAVRILQLVHLAPMLSEMGLFGDSLHSLPAGRRDSAGRR